MLRRIHMSQLRVGMFVESLDGPCLDTPSAGFPHLIATRRDIDRLAALELSGILINTQRGHDICENTASDIEGLLAPVEHLSIRYLEALDEASRLHSRSVSNLMRQLAICLGFDIATTEILALSGLLHDVGKLRIPLEILTKPHALTDAEMCTIKHHPSLGYNILSRGLRMPDIVLDVCIHHHERLDGTGYPFGLQDQNISIYARMATICDVFDALTTARPYKRAWSPREAVVWMRETTGMFDQPLLQRFAEDVVGVDYAEIGRRSCKRQPSAHSSFEAVPSSSSY